MMTDLLDEKIGRADPARSLSESDAIAYGAVTVARAAITNKRRAKAPALAHGRRGLVVLGGGATVMLMTAAAVVTGVVFASVEEQPVAATGTGVSASGRRCAVGVWVLPQEKLYDTASGTFSAELSATENLIGQKSEAPYEQKGVAVLLGGDSGNAAPVFDRAKFEVVRDAVTDDDWTDEISAAVQPGGDEAEISSRLVGLVRDRLEAQGLTLDVNSALLVSTRCDAG